MKVLILILTLATSGVTGCSSHSAYDINVAGLKQQITLQLINAAADGNLAEAPKCAGKCNGLGGSVVLNTGTGPITSTGLVLKMVSIPSWWPVPDCTVVRKMSDDTADDFNFGVRTIDFQTLGITVTKPLQPGNTYALEYTCK